MTKIEIKTQPETHTPTWKDPIFFYQLLNELKRLSLLFTEALAGDYEYEPPSEIYIHRDWKGYHYVVVWSPPRWIGISKHSFVLLLRHPSWDPDYPSDPGQPPRFLCGRLGIHSAWEPLEIISRHARDPHWTIPEPEIIKAYRNWQAFKAGHITKEDFKETFKGL